MENEPPVVLDRADGPTETVAGVGAIVGVLARFLVPGDDPMGIIGTIVLGIVGAVIGGWAAGAIFKDTAGVDWIASVVAAVLLVLLWRAIAGNRSRVT
jgi:uncharacterized membrane protein YeaQ/YmgE (transglycosylase-associated protein family)